jgi:hypothetical protein
MSEEDILLDTLNTISKTLRIHTVHLEGLSEYVIQQQKRIVELEKCVADLNKDSHTHNIVYGHMQKKCLACGKEDGHGGLQCPSLMPDAFDITGVVQ